MKKAGSTRVTAVTDGLVNGWYKWWHKSVNKKIMANLPAECMHFGSEHRGLSEWMRFLEGKTALAEMERVSEESTKFGRNVHSVVEHFLVDSELPANLTEREKTCGGYLVDWCKQVQAAPIQIDGKPAVEVALADEELGLTGHPDLITALGEHLYIVDWKTSSDLRQGYKLQLSAYAHMLEKQHGIRVDDGVIVRVPSDPNAMPQFEIHEVHGLLTKYWPVFEQGLNVFSFYERRGLWKGD